MNRASAVTSRKEQESRAKATADKVRSEMSDPRRGLTPPQIVTGERLAREAWDESKGNRTKAEELLLWKAITAYVVLSKIQPLASSIWDDLAKPKGKPTE